MKRQSEYIVGGVCSRAQAESVAGGDSGELIELSECRLECIKMRNARSTLQKRASCKTSAAVSAISIAIIMLHTRPTQAGLIEIYHKYRPALLDGEEASASTSGSPVDGGTSTHPTLNQTLASLWQQAGDSLSSSAISTSGDQRRATIELHSPMKRLMDLIGHHAPVIVLDSSQDSSGDGQTSAPQDASAVPTQQGGNSINGAASSRPEMGQQSGQAALGGGPDNQVAQLQTQQQQQHWTIVDTSQMMQQQQPTAVAQQQQLIQTSVPNEQYFTFTPFGLQPTSNPFSGLQQGAPMNPYIIQQAQQQQQPSVQQMTQSSQNYQQQQQATGAQAASDGGVMNPVQPIFLSSYVPELPVPGGQQAAPVSYNGQALSPFVPSAVVQQQQQQQQQQQNVQQPNSIQQQIRAQNEERPRDSTNEQANADASEDPDDKSFTSRSKDQDEEEPPASSAASAEPDDEPSGSSAPSSGSSSYEDKYDSDMDEPQQGSTSRYARQQPASSSAGPAANGLISVGLNNDCLQCICRASSGCDSHLGCITIGADEKFCGPFQLTEDYWNRAGSPGDSANNFSSFEECANDADCAVDTVTRYMKKYYRDCDDDHNVTCVDYALLHRLQPNECADTQKLQQGHFGNYWEKFQHCAEGFSRSRNGDDEFI